MQETVNSIAIVILFAIVIQLVGRMNRMPRSYDEIQQEVAGLRDDVANEHSAVLACITLVNGLSNQLTQALTGTNNYDDLFNEIAAIRDTVNSDSTAIGNAVAQNSAAEGDSSDFPPAGGATATDGSTQTQTSDGAGAGGTVASAPSGNQPGDVDVVPPDQAPTTTTDDSTNPQLGGDPGGESVSQNPAPDGQGVNDLPAPNGVQPNVVDGEPVNGAGAEALGTNDSGNPDTASGATTGASAADSGFVAGAGADGQTDSADDEGEPDSNDVEEGDGSDAS